MQDLDGFLWFRLMSWSRVIRVNEKCLFLQKIIIMPEITIKDDIITGQLPRRAAHLVFEWLDLHYDELMENWNRSERKEALLKIEPLK